MNYQQLKQRTKEYQALADWTAIRDFCNQVYGENKAVQVEVNTFGESDDEGGAIYFIEDFIARNEQGERLEFDFSLPFWQQECFVDLDIDDKYEKQDNAKLALKEWYRDETSNSQWITWNELPCVKDDMEYDLTTEPAISFPFQR